MTHRLNELLKTKGHSIATAQPALLSKTGQKHTICIIVNNKVICLKNKECEIHLLG